MAYDETRSYLAPTPAVTDILARYKAHQQHSSNDGPSVHECIAEIERLRAAAKKVYDGLNARLDYAAENGLPHPVFVGIAELHTALKE